MEIKEEKRGGVKIVELRGRLDASNSSYVERQLQILMDQGERRLVVDLSDLVYISSLGLRVLIVFAKYLQKANGRLALAAMNSHIYEVFKIAGFTGIFSIYPTREEAIAYCAG
jgi:stage II sporulation protein AA (anti-sigma F factor antagonist)